MNTLDKSIEIIELYDVYQELLTKKQQEYMESYYYNNYSISEIAENFDISRNAVHDQLKRTVKKLYDYEEKLKLKLNIKKRKTIINKIREEENLSEIHNLVEELEKVE